MAIAARLWAVGLGLALSVLSPLAAAITVPVGATVTLPGTTVAERPELGGASLLPNSFGIINSTTPGAYQARVDFDAVREPGTGFLDFTYRVVGSDHTTPLRWQFKVDNLAMLGVLETDVLLDSAGKNVPIQVTHNVDGTATFTSSEALQPGESTKTFFIRAAGIKEFRQSGSILLVTDFGSEPAVPGLGSPNTTVSGPGYGPIPEPASTGLLILGLAALAARYRRPMQPARGRRVSMF